VVDQPFDARAALRERRLPLVSSEPAPLIALELPPPVLEAAEPAPVVDVPAAPDVLAPAPIAPLPLFDAPPPGAVGAGFAAPISPADVPGPARPALSVSAGDPCAAYAPATAADMQPATNANMSFLIITSRKKLLPRPSQTATTGGL
jgi:hypothetical protein